MRRTVLWLLLAVVAPPMGVLSADLIYPAKATLSFYYQGRHYEASFVTLMTARLCEFTFCRYVPGRKTTSVPLADGSLLIVMPEWPYPWEDGFLRRGGTYSSRARWMWLNHALSPTEIVSGHGKSRLSTERSGQAPFPWLLVEAKVERIGSQVISELLCYLRPAYFGFCETPPMLSALIEAVVADRRSDKADRIVANDWYFRRDPRVPTGQLFAGIELAPMRPEGLMGIKESSDWVSLDGGCRMLFRTLRRGLTADKGVTRGEITQTRVLRRQGDLWTTDAGPHPGEAAVMYPVGALASIDLRPAGTTLSFTRRILEELHNIDRDGKICKIADWPSDSFGAYFDFGDDKIMGLFPSLTWVVVRETRRVESDLDHVR